MSGWQQYDYDQKPSFADVKPSSSSLLGYNIHKAPKPVEVGPLEGLDKRTVVEPFEEGTYDPTEATQQRLQGVLDNVNILLTQKSIKDVAGANRVEGWKKELAALKERSKQDHSFFIAVVGSTGAGKSSLINALLGHDSLVPTNSMRACTAVVTELSWNKQDRKIRAEVEFLSPAEWLAELEIIRDDLINEYGDMKTVGGDEVAEAAWARINAVYPQLKQRSPEGHNICYADLSDKELLKKGIAKTALGTTQKIVASNSAEFLSKIGRFLDSREKDLGKGKKGKGKEKEKRKEKIKPEFWPLIKRVKVFVRHESLKTGAVLVDLPGVADSNEARGKIAKTYMRNAEALFIVAPQTRAVDDRVASELMGESFKRQLQMDGGFDRVTFVTTRSDDCSPTEIIRSIPALKEKTDPLDDAIHQKAREVREARKSTKELEDSVAQNKKDISNLDKEIKDLAAKIRQKSRSPAKRALGRSPSKKSVASEIITLDSDDDDDAAPSKALDSDSDSEDELLTQRNKRRKAAQKKKKKVVEESDSDDDIVVVGDGEASLETLKSQLEAKKTRIAALKEANTKLEVRQAPHLKAINKAEKKIAKYESEKKRICALARNDYTRRSLKQDFRNGIKVLDDQMAEAAQGAAFDETAVRRDYEKIDLPVFCCSSREYAKMTGLVQGDGAAQVFEDERETGIPALRKHVAQLAVKPRYSKAAATLKTSQDLLDAMYLFFNSKGFDKEDAASLRHAFKTYIQGAEAQLFEVAKNAGEDASQLFDTLIENTVAGGVDKAADALPNTINYRYLNLHHSTWRALIRRSGTWIAKNRLLDMNADMIQPFITHIAGPWEQLFSSPDRLVRDYVRSVLEVVDTFARDLASAAASRDAVAEQFDFVKKGCRAQLQNRLDAILEQLLAKIGEEQKDYTRNLTPVLTALLDDTYSTAFEYRGKGCTAKSKGLVGQYILGQGENLFIEVQKDIQNKLDLLADLIVDHLSSQMPVLLQVIRDSFSTLWEKHGTSDIINVKRKALYVTAVNVERDQMAALLASVTPAPALRVATGDSDDEDEDDDDDDAVLIEDDEMEQKGAITTEGEDEIDELVDEDSNYGEEPEEDEDEEMSSAEEIETSLTGKASPTKRTADDAGHSSSPGPGKKARSDSGFDE